MESDHVIRIILRAHDEISSTMNKVGKSIEKVGDADMGMDDKADEVDNLTRNMERLLGPLDKTSAGFGRLAFSIRGIAIAFVIKHIQSLLSGLVALGGELVSVASAAVSAGYALGGALVSGISQAIPVVGLLVGAFQRVGIVMQAVEAQQNAQQYASRNASAAADAQRGALDALRGANEQLEQAQRNQVDAQKAITEARRLARMELQDLVLAERGAMLGLEDARREMENAIQSGDVIGVDTSSLELDSSRLEARRAERELGDASRKGIEGSDQVVNAKRQLADANRAVADAQRALTDAQRAGTEAASGLSAQEENLAFALSELTEAERGLYQSIIRIKDRAKELFRPITDIIIGSFSNAIDRVGKLMDDESLMNSFTGLSKVIAAQIDEVSKFFTNDSTTRFFERMIDEASRNLPLITDIFKSWAKVWMNISDAAAPFLNELLSEFSEWSKEFERTEGSVKSLSGLFADGADAFQAWLDVAQAIWHILSELFTTSLPTGISELEKFAGTLEGWGDALERNRGEQRQFFEDAASGASSVGEVLVALGAAIYEVFDPKTVAALADFLIQVLIPAVRDIVEAMGIMMKAFHTVTTLPVVGELIRFITTSFLLTRALEMMAQGMRAIVSVVLPLFAVRTSATVSSLGLLRGWLVLAVSAFFLFRDGASFIGDALGGIGDAIGRLLPDFENLGDAVITVMAIVASFITVTILARSLAFGVAVVSITTKIKLLTAAMARNPFGLIVFGLGAVAGALGLFGEDQETAEDRTKASTESMWAQIDAINALDDALDNERDAKLGVREAETELLVAQRARREVIAQIASGDLKGAEARIAKQQATQRLARAENNLDDANERLREAPQKIRREAEATAEATTTRIEAIRDQIVASEDQQEEYRRLIDLEKNLMIPKRENVRMLREEIRAGDDSTLTLEKLETAQEDLKESIARRRSISIKLREEEEQHAGYLEDNAAAHRKFDRAMRRSGQSAIGFGEIIGLVSEVVIDQVDEILKEFGVKPMSWTSNAVKALGSVASVTAGLFGATGGMIPGYSTRDDTLIHARSGEAILRPEDHIPYVNSALQLAYGDDIHSMFRRTGAQLQKGARSFARGGIAQAVGAAQQMGLSVGEYGPPGTITSGHATNSYHYSGLAADVSGAASLMMSYFMRMMNTFQGKGLAELFYDPAGFYIDNDTRVAGSIGGHSDHVHVAILGDAARSLAGMTATFEEIKKIRLQGPKGRLKDGAQGIADMLVKEANKFAESKAPVSTLHGDMGNYQGSVARIFSRVSKELNAPAKAALALFEAGIVESGMTNVSGGHSTSRGALQLLASTAAGLGVDPMDVDAVANLFLTRGFTGAGGAISLSQNNPGMTAGNIAQAVQGSAFPERYDQQEAAARALMAQYGFAQGGFVPGAVGQAVNAIVHAGEVVLNPIQQAALGGPGFFQSMFGFKGPRGDNSFAEGGFVGDTRVARLYAINIAERDLKDLERDVNRMTKKGGFEKFRKAIDDLLGEGGTFDDLAERIDAMIQRMATASLRAVYRVFNGRVFRRRTELDEDKMERQNLNQTGDLLRDELQQLNQLKRKAKRMQDKLIRDRKQADTDKEREAARDALDKVKAALNNIRNRQAEVQDQIAQNLADQYANMQAVFDQLVDDFNEQIAKLDLRRRILELQGEISGTVDTEGIIALTAAQGDILEDERALIKRRLTRAQAAGDKELVQALQMALLENQLALLENSKELRELNGQLGAPQSFSSSLWDMFRVAVFNGQGGLLPEFQIPGMATGGIAGREGAYWLHPGEVVRNPAIESGTVGENHYHFTNPVETADPEWIGTAVSWHMKQKRAIT